jgi:chromate transport protein ChrA
LDERVSPEALVLALSTVIRPMSAAAVFAMISAARPARLLLAYIVAGFVLSCGWASPLSRQILVVAFGLLGIYLIVKGGSVLLA